MSSEFQRRQKDQRFLLQSFYQSFDQSQIIAALERHIEAPARSILTPIGGGIHSEVFHYRPQGGASSSVPLALSLLRQPIEGDRWDAEASRWRQALDYVGRQNLLLVPPMESFPCRDRLVLVTPYGEDPIDQAADHWQPIHEVIQQATDQLKQHGLVIDDHLQGRSCQGIPFFCDFSDLMWLGPPGFHSAAVSSTRR